MMDLLFRCGDEVFFLCSKGGEYIYEYLHEEGVVALLFSSADCVENI
jgi:hypothetical protein